MKQAIDFLSEKEPIFKSIIETFGLPNIPSRPQGFQTLVLLILEQQVSIDSAKATFNKLQILSPDLEPELLSELTEEVFRSIGVSRQKASYIKGLAKAILNKEIDLESLPSKSAQQVREELIQFKGIGNWTIDIYLMFALDAPDIFPIGDIAVVNTMKEFWGFETREAMLLQAENWQPYKSYATYLLWHHYLRKRNRTVVY